MEVVVTEIEKGVVGDVVKEEVEEVAVEEVV